MSKITLYEQASAPATPDSGTAIVYVKSDGQLYLKDDTGTETDLTAGGGATIQMDNLGTTAINADLLFDTDGAYTIGSSAARVSQIWADSVFAALELEVYNDSGAEIVIEKVVYISGFHVGSGLPTIALADHDSAGAEEAIGVSHEAIANNASGHIIVSGETTYPTAGLSVGDCLYVSDTPGELTDTRPTTGIISEVGKILKIGASGNGKIFVNIDGGVHLDASETLTNKTIDADNNTVSNIGAAEVKVDIISGQTIDGSPDSAADYVLTQDASAGALKRVLLNNLPSGSTNSFAILRDEKATTVNGGACSATTWNARDLNTEASDADAIVSIASNQFTPISGDYILHANAPAFAANEARLRLYNVTGTASVEEGQNARGGSGEVVMATALLTCNFTANGTDAYRIDHYTTAARATDGLGQDVSDGSAEVYMEILLEKVG